jgi:hypothetical protein
MGSAKGAERPQVVRTVEPGADRCDRDGSMVVVWRRDDHGVGVLDGLRARRALIN